MPWKIINTMDQKIQLIADWQKNIFSITDLSQKYGISRPTIYKLIRRYKQHGIEGLKELSRAPKTCPHKTPAEVVGMIIQEKLKNCKRGPRKIRVQLKNQYPELPIPTASTIGYCLKKEGLVKKRKKRLSVTPYTQAFHQAHEPNDSWSIDYKGQFYMQNQRVCYPLTVTDNASRYILGCEALEGPRYIPTRKCLETIFREYGVPYAIRSDNGIPFAGKGIGGLSQLSIWFIQLGIIPERIKKGCPQENGRHERMHRTLKYETLDMPAKNLKEQQKIFDFFRYDFNHERPHESLNDKTPHDYYKKSNRPYVERPYPPVYDLDYTVRQVRHRGEIKFQGQLFFISELLASQPLGLKEVDEGLWQINYSFYVLGMLDLKKNMIIRI